MFTTMNNEKFDHLIQGDPDRLLKYSPKYDTIVNQIKSVHGLILYTQNSGLIGRDHRVFSVVFIANRIRGISGLR